MEDEARGRKAKRSLLLVIDASVMRAAGSEGATAPIPKNCREILLTVLKVCHRVGTSPKILDEWKRHQSRFAKRWLTSMYARRKVVQCRVGEQRTRRFAEIPPEKLTEQELAALLKDAHLVDAADAADKIVLSLDRSVRVILDKTVSSIPDLAHHVWIDPSLQYPEITAWLEERGPIHPAWRLGA